VSSIGSQGIEISGKYPNQYFGKHAELLGDINGDGIDDFVIYVSKLPKYVIYGTTNEQLSDVSWPHLLITLGLKSGMIQ
jgi:hypothetical protein